jgi:hypothetical protein
MATSYLDLFLRTITEPNLLKIFLKFILYAKVDGDETSLIDVLIGRINSNNKVNYFFFLLLNFYKSLMIFER